MPISTKDPEPPLVDVKVTNPITYIKRWWQRIIGNEGIDLRFRIRPLTAIAIAVIVSSIAFGVGRFVFPFTIPFFEFEEGRIVRPSLPPEGLWRSTAYVGTLQFTETTNKFYLVTTSSEAITLDVPDTLDLKDFIGRRILAVGDYNKVSRTLKVSDAKDMEVLPKKPVTIPTNPPTPTLMPTIPAREPTSTPTEIPQQVPSS